MATEPAPCSESFLCPGVLRPVPSAAASLCTNRALGRRIAHASQSRALRPDARTHTECSSQGPPHRPLRRREASLWQSNLQCPAFAARSPAFLETDTQKCESEC